MEEKRLMEAIDGSDYLNGSDYFRCNCNCKVEVRCECLQVAEMVVPGQGGSCALAAGRAKELMHRDRAFLQLTSRDFDARCRKVDLWLVFVGRVCPEGFWVCRENLPIFSKPGFFGADCLPNKSLFSSTKPFPRLADCEDLAVPRTSAPNNSIKPIPTLQLV